MILGMPLVSLKLSFTICKVGRSITADTMFPVVGSDFPFVGVSLYVHALHLYW